MDSFICLTLVMQSLIACYRELYDGLLCLARRMKDPSSINSSKFLLTGRQSNTRNQPDPCLPSIAISSIVAARTILGSRPEDCILVTNIL